MLTDRFVTVSIVVEPSEKIGLRRKRDMCADSGKGGKAVNFIQNIDWAILHFIRDNLFCPFLDSVMPIISALGNKGIIWIAISAALLFSKKYRKYGLLCLCGMLIGLLVGNVAIKSLVARPRPCWTENISLLIKNPTDFSFPSGHTLSSVISAVILCSAGRKFAAFAIPLAAFIAISRLYLYVHFPSDVIFAALLGIAIGFMTLALSKKVKAIQKL